MAKYFYVLQSYKPAKWPASNPIDVRDIQQYKDERQALKDARDATNHAAKGGRNVRVVRRDEETPFVITIPKGSDGNIPY